MKPINLIKAVLFILLTVASVGANAQVTVGSEKKAMNAAVLGIKTQESATAPTSVIDINNVTSTVGGLGLSKVQLVNRKTLEPFITGGGDATQKIKHAGLIVYNIKEQVGATLDTTFEPGTYVWDGAQWNLLGCKGSEGARWFYLPSFDITVTVGSTGSGSVDLYNDVYNKQFTKTGNATFVASDTNIATIFSPINGRLYADNELYYVVTYFYPAVMTITGITASGVMSYTTTGTAPTEKSYVNVIAIVK